MSGSISLRAARTIAWMLACLELDGLQVAFMACGDGNFIAVPVNETVNIH